MIKEPAMKTKHESLRLSIVFLFLLCFTYCAFGEISSGFEYSVEDNKVTITGYVGEASELAIPSSIDGKPVVCIGDKAFYNCLTIKSVSIPSSVEAIGLEVFSGCQNLEAIHVDENNENYSSVSGVLFSKDAKNLIIYPSGKQDEYYAVPEGVASIEQNAFKDCRNLLCVFLPNSYVHSGNCFSTCGNLISFLVDANNPNYTSVDGVLYDKNRKTLILYPAGKIDDNCLVPNGVEAIGEYAFANCGNLLSITIPASVTNIGEYAFAGCSAIKEIVFRGVRPSFPLNWHDGSLAVPITFSVPRGKGWEDFSSPDVKMVFREPMTQTLHLTQGWNLCALTIAPDEESINKLDNLGDRWGWVNARFMLLENFLPGQGFWIYAHEDVQLNLSGEKAFPPSLHPGWNLVGADDNLKAELLKNNLTAWQLNQKQYEQVNGIFTSGLAYWIFKPTIIRPRVSFTLVPTDGMWRIDNGEWNVSGTTTTVEAGIHGIDFKEITGYKTPPSLTVNLMAEETLVRIVDYEIIPPMVAYTLNPPSGKWRIDDGDWNDSGAVVTTAVGAHTISFQAIDGYTTPVNETIALAAGEKLYKTVDYEAIPPTVTVTLNPVTGKWRIDDGDWYDSDIVVTTEVGVHTISFQAIDGYTTPAAMDIVLTAGEHLSKAVDYDVIPPTVAYTLNPPNAKWRIDDGNWNNSCAVVMTTVGTHTISFEDVDGYTTPAAQNITLAAGEKLSKSVDYTGIQPMVTYTLNPSKGKWRLDGGGWNNSGATVATTVGEHTVNFQDIDGYTTPENQSITLQLGEQLFRNVAYEIIPPTVIYMLNPSSGKWRIDKGEWNDSGVTATTTVDRHTISFQAVDGYTTPSSQSITLTAGQRLSKSVDYKPIQPTVSYTLNPTSGKWSLDGGEWNRSGATVTTTAGEHTVSFQDIDGYTTPAVQNIMLTFGERLSQNVVYEVIPPTVTVTLNPPEGKWRIDDGEWNDSGATVATTVGSHTISFMELDGYNAPASQNLMLAAGRDMTRTASYTVIQPTVCYTLVPDNAKWRIDSGSWNDSGATVTTKVGSHKISFQTVDGYTTPVTQDIVLVAGENFSSNIAYEVIQPTVTYTLNPTTGKWRLDNGAWYNSGATVTTTVGNHSISFQAVTNYITPVKQNITLTAGENLNTLVAYDPVPPTVTYTLNPPSGKWRIDDGEWNYSGVTVTTTVGEHTVSFMNMLGYIEPTDLTIVLEAGGTHTYNAEYEKHDPLYVVVDLSSGPDSDSYPVRGTDTPPDLNNDTCRTTELWLRKIPAGTFMMGSPNGEIGHEKDEVLHEVTLTQDFYIGVFECTQRQWELVMGTRPSYFINSEYYATRPVENVSYDMIRGATSTDESWPRSGHGVMDLSFMERLQTKTGLIFDLPTDAQWEYACRAGTTTALNSENNLLSNKSDYFMNEVGRYSYNGGSGSTQNCTDENGTATVGSYLPNTWGLYDMHGNVNEWCLDWYEEDLKTNPVTDPDGPFYLNSAHIVRGGSWRSQASSCRSAWRADSKQVLHNPRYNWVGFRIVYLNNCQPIINCILNTSNGKWRLDNDEWNDSKISITTTTGTHILSYRDINIPGYHTPPEQQIVLEAGHVYKRIEDYILDGEFVIVDLSSGPNAESYPVRCSNTPPDLDDDICRTSELWLRHIKAGTFIMGSPEDELGRDFYRETQHKVILTKDYFIGVFECTQRQWELVMGTRPSLFNNFNYYMVRPVENINYKMVRGTNNIDPSSFIGKLQAKTGLLFDLPTEAQWEYACRAGMSTALNSGKDLKSSTSDDGMAEVGRYKYNGGKYSSSNCSTDQGTAKVGSYLPNAWGLYDMHGNVWEYCQDLLYELKDYGSEIVIDPVQFIHSRAVIRGGYYSSEANACRSAARSFVPYGTVYPYYGFRIVYFP